MQKDKKGSKLINVTNHSDNMDRVNDLLKDLLAMLDTLLRDDQPGHIDLGTLSLNQTDRQRLVDILGQNGTMAEVHEYGHSQISSTGISGVWWVMHLDDEGHLLGEFLEVNYCPEVLIAASEDVYEGREALKARLFEAGLAQRKKNPEL